MAQLDAHWTGDQEVGAMTPARLASFFHGDYIMVILFLPLIQAGQLSVSGERMGTVLSLPSKSVVR